MYFTYDVSLKIEEIINHSIKGKLKLWKCRNLTITDIIQIVKTFVVPMIILCVGSTGLHKTVIKEGNSIEHFDFIRKGRQGQDKTVLYYCAIKELSMIIIGIRKCSYRISLSRSYANSFSALISME